METSSSALRILLVDDCPATEPFNKLNTFEKYLEIGAMARDLMESARWGFQRCSEHEA